MRFVSKYLLIFIAVISFAGFLPHLFSVASGKRVDRPIVFYSVIINDFVYTLSDKSGKRSFFDASGKEYTAREHAELLPFMYYRDLEKWGIYPETINGQSISPNRASLERDFTTIHSYAIDGERVRVKLYPLFESNSGFTTVEMPPELFRITSRMEFINAVTNSVNEEKSRLFTDALTNAGFKFPAVMFAGNPTTKKPYDAGYFVTDSNNRIFHLMQVKGQPSVIDTGIDPDGNVLLISVKENEHLRQYGLLITDTGNVYHILKDGYELKKLYVENYSPLKQTLRYIEDPMNFTLKVVDEFGEAAYVSDRNYEPVKSFYYDYERRVRGVLRTVYDTVFPFDIRNNPNTYGKYPQFKLSENLPAAFIFSAVLAIFYSAFRIFRNQKRAMRLPFEVFLILIGGIYAVLALILTDRSRED